MRYPHGCSSGCTPELCCSWTSQDCALRSAFGLPGRQYSCGWTPQVGAPGRRTFPAVCRSIATGSVLPHWVAHLRPPSGARSWMAFLPSYLPVARPLFPKVRTPRFPLVQGFPTGSFLIRIPLIAPFTFHFLSLRYGKQARFPSNNSGKQDRLERGGE
jgi:hypothetical protein